MFGSYNGNSGLVTHTEGLPLVASSRSARCLLEVPWLFTYTRKEDESLFWQAFIHTQSVRDTQHVLPSISELNGLNRRKSRLERLPNSVSLLDIGVRKIVKSSTRNSSREYTLLPQCDWLSTGAIRNSIIIGRAWPTYRDLIGYADKSKPRGFKV